MQLNYFIRCLLLVVMCFAIKVQANNERFEISAQPLTIAINKTTYPYMFLNDKGQADGLMPDLWTLWAERQGVEIKFITTDWLSTLSRVKSGEIDIHGGMTKTVERSKEFSLTPSFFYHDFYFYTHRDFTNLTEISQLSPYIIGSVIGSSHAAIILENYPHLKLRLYANRYALYQAALDNEIMVYTGVEKPSKLFSEYFELNKQYPPYKRISFYQGEYVAATSLNNKLLKDFIVEGFDKVTAAEKSLIEKKWLGREKNSKTLLLSFLTQAPPYMAVSPTGQPQGLFIDLWRLWAKESGIEIEFIAQSPSQELAMLQDGDVDIHIGYSAENFDNQLQIASQIYGVDAGVFVSTRIDNVYSLKDLQGKKIGILAGTTYENTLINMYPNLKVQVYQTTNELLHQAELGNIDAMVSAQEYLNARLIQSNLQSSFYQLKNVTFPTPVYSLVKKGNDKLVELIKEGFANIPIEQLIRLERNWLIDKHNGYFVRSAEKVSLSNSEQSWLEQHQKISVGLVKNWMPMEFVNAKGQVTGINPDVLKLISDRSGLAFEFTFFDSWSDLYQGLIEQKIDMLASVSVTQERKKQVIFTQSYWSMPWVILHQRQLGSQLTLNSFHGKELAVIKGYYLSSTIRKAHPLISLKLVDNHNAGLLAVQQGKVDGFISNIASASELMKRESLSVLDMSVLEELQRDSSHFAIRPDWLELQQIINKTLLTISENEKQKIYDRWFGVNIETGFNKDVVMRVAAQIGVLILIVIIAIIMWNRRLYGEIKTRKLLEEKMKHMATHDELTGLANRVLLKDRINTAISFHQRQQLQIAVLFIDLDGFKTINDTHGHDVGDELLVKVANKLKSCVRQSDTVVRFGGDEFVLLLTGLHKKSEAAYIADKVLKLMQQPFELSVERVNIGCSIGIAMYPDDGVTDNDLLKIADTLMYRVKANGKNHYVFSSETYAPK
ncbi:transporter substrate-binding domain-containing protein [Colwellia hornerae]|uniref:Transporter substrate-binding domain-containing protein n=1 Tax=Colwellia hornerae TaxID=89402 RepID=A0A5C6QN75_9GAMM|nr:transporter substrate-binding domain-containing protein [Colwellia hornerae]TWX54606.1 transporter substrate-binding domain-containing protein [Colwellia hornerae]TWX61046.1 transporter substrate-binding domain-containing protein [Colwellia hornerae]TWX70299.1 transporter substrate-binding domain-containing protein [Colwellia hornerae]